MTKAVRIENADTSIYKLKVLVQERDYTSGDTPWYTVREQTLDNPTDMLTEFIWSGKRLVIEEA